MILPSISCLWLQNGATVKLGNEMILNEEMKEPTISEEMKWSLMRKWKGVQQVIRDKEMISPSIIDSWWGK